MLTRPTFKPHFHVEIVPGEGVFLLSGPRQSLLKGPLYEHVAACLDGRTVDDVCEQLHGQHSPAEVYYTLMQLEKKGYLCEHEEGLAAEEAALWSPQVEPAMAARRLAEMPVVLRPLGVDAGPLAALLQAAHVRLQDDGALEVVLTDSYLRKDLQAVNAAALESGRPWLLCRPLGREIWLGPLFRPGATGCWECLAQRLRSNRPVESYLHERDSRPGPLVVDRARTAATLHTAWGLIAHAVTAWVVQQALPALEGKVQTFDLASWQLQTHTLFRLPYCPACVAPVEERTRSFQPVTLQGQKKTFIADGGHRVVSPEATLERYRQHISSITGAVGMLERISPTSADAMHVYVAGTNFARKHRSLAQVRSDLRNMSCGKGATDLQARASGLCEGLERYSGVFRGDEPRRRARMAELGERAIHLHDCLHFSERQYRERDAWNARESHFNFVPLPFDPEAEIDWSPVWSLTRGHECYLPTAFCYFDYPNADGRLFCLGDSNGNAAGNTLEEAILQGFLELVERDSVALWWYNRVRRPAVAVDSFDEPYLHELQAFLRQQERNLWVLDLTSDLGIPVFVALSRRLGGAGEQIVLGFGAHLEARVALLRAVTEMNQMLSQVIGAPADRVLREEVTDLETIHWLKTATVTNQPYLLPAEGMPDRTASSYARTWTEDMADDVRACQAIVQGQGLEMLVLDQTRPEVGLPVAKVIVPGLRHFWARFAPGRLYDVPVRLGWLPQPLAEEDLNPMPMFL